MLKYLSDFCAEFSYTDDAREALMTSLEQIGKKPETRTAFYDLVNEYNLDGDILSKLDGIADGSGVHKYSVHLLYFICLSKKLRGMYRERNIPDDIFFDSMCDLKYKLKECLEVYGIYGSFVADWFPRFFRLTRFALGRLQYETAEIAVDYAKNGANLKKGDTVLNVHIPSSGRMPAEALEASYNKAAKFYADIFTGRPVVFVCNSWLLFPKHREFLPPNSNILRFMEDYDIISEKEDTDFKNLWRFFGKKYTGDIRDMPADNSLRRAYIDWIANGNKTGTAYGVYVYTGK